MKKRVRFWVRVLLAALALLIGWILAGPWCLLAVPAGFLAVTAYSCCVVAGRVDEIEERYWREKK